ncbi:MAG: type II toxin-antitoxin system VapC family toxin [Epsilonproteobacteria bacterium]|nr:type II toxin-antitoxin system VapC family toxin [Campylobacterota bacterium]
MNIFLDANICLDLLDSKRPTSTASIEWYMSKKDDDSIDFYFSSDFITTFYYVLTEKRKYDASEVIATIEALSFEITPFYLAHGDFLNAKSDFFGELFDDFEDLMVLNSAVRAGCEVFVTNDKALLEFEEFKGMRVSGV